jgi:hypothetical protein
MGMSERVLHRFAEAVAKPRFKWEQAYNGQALMVSLYVGRKVVGKLYLVKSEVPKEESGWGLKCHTDIEKLKGDGHIADSFWIVHYTEIPDLANRGKGLGKIMYEAALEELARKNGPSYAGPANCGFATVSDAAQHVWNSIRGKHTHAGDVIFVKP